MKIVIPDDYQNMIDRLDCFALIRHHDVIRYREPAPDLATLVARLRDADVVVSIRERVAFSRALLEQLPKLKLIALVGRNSHVLDFSACTELGIPVATGKSNSPVAPAELTLSLIMSSRRNVALEAERMRRGDWPCTLSHRLRGSTLGIFGLGAIGQLVAEGCRGLGMNVPDRKPPPPAIRWPPASRTCSSAPTFCRCMSAYVRRRRASSARRTSPA